MAAYEQIPLFTDDEGLDTERLNQLLNNMNTLNNNKVRFWYNAYGVTKYDGLKVAAGTIDMSNASNVWRKRWVFAGNWFTPGSRIIGSVTLSSGTRKWTFVSIANRTGDSPTLDHTGMEVCLATTQANLAGAQLINYTMLGY